MKIYKDKEKTKEVSSTLDFGAVMAGEKQKFEYFIENDTKAELKDIKFTVIHDELHIIKAPSHLKPHETASLVVEWSPSITIKQGLKSQLRIEAMEYWSS